MRCRRPTKKRVWNQRGRLEAGSVLGKTLSIAKIAIDLSAPNLKRAYDYLIPDELAAETELGSTVIVPVRQRKCLGYVVGIEDESAADGLKSILGLVEGRRFISPAHIDLSHWMADHYLTSFSEIIKLTLPPGGQPNLQTLLELANEGSQHEPALKWLADNGGCATRRRMEGAFTKYKIQSLIKNGALKQRFRLREPSVKPLIQEFADLNKAVDISAVRGQKQLLVLNELTKNAPIPVKELLGRVEASRQTLNSLVSKGFVSIFSKPMKRDSKTSFTNAKTSPITLNQEQDHALTAITSALTQNTYHSFLLEGITGSGKTEVYMRAAEICLKDDKSVIFLVPEISLLPQLVERLANRFGKQVALLHSGLKAGERFDAWHEVANGNAKVVVGPRSALFAPVDNLGLIVLDEEHETSYKQNVTPRYDARVVARKLARINNAALVMGSATPSLESQSLVRSEGTHLRLQNRVFGFNEPSIEIVDMRETPRIESGTGLISKILFNNLKQTIDQGHKAILLLNRRGFANFLLCRKCGFVPVCANCAISLTFHKVSNRLRCHHCGLSKSAPETCPECKSSNWKFGGIGTQRIEGELTTLFPETRVIRMDSDSTSARGAHHRHLQNFYETEGAILLGTQMIAKGLDFPDVALVGIINADTALNIPDFRAAERTAQLLTQVSGRSGRGPIPGKVIIQTYNPDNYAVRAVESSYSDFCEIETKHRSDLDYPPFTSIINIIFSSQNEKLVEPAARELAQNLIQVLKEKAQILGPVPAPISRIKGRWRWHLMIVTKDPKWVKKILRTDVDLTSRHKNVKIIADVDPIWLL